MYEQAGSIDVDIDNDQHHGEVQAALATARALQDSIRTLATLIMHEHRLARKFEATLKQLTALQSDRRHQEKSELAEAARLLEMHQDAELPYDPTADGFVFTNAAIATFAERKSRSQRRTRRRPPLFNVRQTIVLCRLSISSVTAQLQHFRPYA